MEQEFKRTGLNQQGPAFGKLLIDKLRQTRKEYPTMDMLAGNLPFVGGMQAGMDMTDESLPTMDRGMSALSMVPGGKLLGKMSSMVGESALLKKIAERLREGREISMPADEKEAARKAANQAYIDQLLSEGGDLTEEVLGRKELLTPPPRK